MLKAKSCSSASWAAGQTLSDPTAVAMCRSFHLHQRYFVLYCNRELCFFPFHSAAISGLCLTRIRSVYFDIEITAI